MQIVKTEADPLFRTDDEKDIEAVQMCQVSGGGGGFALVLRWFCVGFTTLTYIVPRSFLLSLFLFFFVFFSKAKAVAEKHTFFTLHIDGSGRAACFTSEACEVKYSSGYAVYSSTPNPLLTQGLDPNSPAPAPGQCTADPSGGSVPSDGGGGGGGGGGGDGSTSGDGKGVTTASPSPAPSNTNSTSSMGEGDTGAASQLQVGAAAVASAAIAIAAMVPG